ncbi:gas vesicle protein [Streptomyces sp. B1866]|uniref:gas vesicle protein n=1 Tax=Streptomyces sp. B1866 TaxID=3075431 RepID=UPI00288F33E1|nr:gas vesicle protein [Streptomyces sp. B1866]MDT3400294.1 gas vesicle protein [Streptomyces sp. B1866]
MGRPVPRPGQAASPYQQGTAANLADILERVLDKGIVIAGDIQINLLDIELLTIKLRLLVASVDKAKEMGIDWWEHDPSLSSRAREEQSGRPALAEENRRLRAEVERLRERPAVPPPAPREVAAADEYETATEYETYEYDYPERDAGEEDVRPEAPPPKRPRKPAKRAPRGGGDR